MDSSTLPRPVDLTSIEPAAVSDAYDRLGLQALSDEALVSSAAAVIDRPKAAAPDSFVLHAPLELMARAGLLGRVAPEARSSARHRLVWFAATYAAAGDPAPDPPRAAFADASVAGSSLAAAISAGDLDGADAAAAWLADHVGRLDLATVLVDVVAPSLAGAAHGGIFLHQLLSWDAAPAAPGARHFARELARYPDLRLSWFQDRPDGSGAGGSVAALVAALLRPESPGPLDSNFIYPTMHLTESSGLARGLLGPALAGVDRSEAGTALLRVAALSMLQDDPGQAPYGWSHCLTMPHGLLEIAALAPRPDDVLAVAATYVLGFRATLGAVALDPSWVPDRLGSGVDAVDALAGSPADAASAAWHAGGEDLARVTTALASYAAGHPDAHLVKYTLACLQLAVADAQMCRLYLAAAAYLGAWWRARPVSDDLLA